MKRCMRNGSAAGDNKSNGLTGLTYRCMAPEQQVGYYGTPQGHYYSTIGPYVLRYRYGPPEFSPMRE